MADALSRMFINPSLVPSLSDFISHSIDSLQPLPTFRAPQDLSSSFKVIPSLPKTTPNNSSHRLPPITSHPTSITSAAMTRSQTKKSQSPAPKDNSPTGSIHDQYHRDRDNKEYSAPPATMQMPPNNSAAEALFSLVANDPSFRPRPLRLPKHIPNNQDSFLAATFSAQHALMHYLSCGDSSCFTHYSSHLNSNRPPKDNWCAYYNRKGHDTTCCELNRQDKEYFEQEQGAKESQERQDSSPPRDPPATSPHDISPKSVPSLTSSQYSPLNKGKGRAISIESHSEQVSGSEIDDSPTSPTYFVTPLAPRKISASSTSSNGSDTLPCPTLDPTFPTHSIMMPYYWLKGPFTIEGFLHFNSATKPDTTNISEAIGLTANQDNLHWQLVSKNTYNNLVELAQSQGLPTNEIPQLLPTYSNWNHMLKKSYQKDPDFVRKIN